MKNYLKVFLVGLMFAPLVSLASIDKNLSYGSRGSAVTELQEFLIDQNFLQGTATGNFFSLTLKAVKAFQSAHNIPSTGYVGMLSRAEINSELASALASSTQEQVAETGTTTVNTSTSTNPLLTTLQQQNALLQQQLQAQQQTNTLLQNQSQNTTQPTTVTPTIPTAPPSVTLDPSYNNTALFIGNTGTTIARYLISNNSSVDFKISSLIVTPQINGATSGQNLNNVALYANGSPIGLIQNFTGSPLTYNFGSPLVIPAGKTVSIAVNADSNNLPGGDTLVVVLTGTTNNGQYAGSQQTFTVPGTSGITSNSLTTYDPSKNLSVIQDSSFTNVSLSPNTTHQKIGSFQITPSQNNPVGYQVYVTGLTVNLQSSANFSDLSNLTLVGSGINATPINIVQASNSFPSNSTISPNGAGGYGIVDVYADVGPVADTVTATISVTDRDSGDWGRTINSVPGQVVAPVLPPPPSFTASAVSGNNTVANFNFQTSANSSVTELGFTISGSNAQNVSAIGINISGTNGTLSTCPVTNGTANFSSLSIPVPAGSVGANIGVIPTFSTTPSSGSTTTITLNYIKAISGNTVFTPTVSAVSSVVSQ